MVCTVKKSLVILSGSFLIRLGAGVKNEIIVLNYFNNHIYYFHF